MLDEERKIRDWPAFGPNNRAQIHKSRMVIARGPESDIIGETKEFYVDEGGVCKSSCFLLIISLVIEALLRNSAIPLER